MKVLSVRYEEVNNLGNFENQRIGVEVEVGEDDTAQATLDAAKAFVARNLTDPMRDRERQRLQAIVTDPENHSPRLVAEAQAELAKLHAALDDCPF